MRVIHSFSLLFVLGIRNLGRNPKRTLITIFAVSIAVWSALFLSSLARGLSDRMRREAIRTLTGHIQIHKGNYLNDPAIQYRFSLTPEAIRAALTGIEVKAISCRVRVPGVIKSERAGAGVTLIGIHPEQEAQASFLGDNAEQLGRFERGALVGVKLLENLETKVGRRIVLLSEGADTGVTDRGYRISDPYRAELQSTELSYVFVPIAELQRQLGIGDELTEISIVLVNDRDLDIAIEKLRSSFPELDIQPWTVIQPFAEAITRIQGGFLRLWFGFVVVTVAFGLVNTIFMAIFERKRELAMTQALGMTRGQVITQVVLESLVIVIPSLVAGSLLFMLSFWGVSGGIDLSKFARGFQYFGMSSTVYPVFRLDDFIILNIMVAAIAVIGSLYPAWRAAQYNVIQTVAER